MKETKYYSVLTNKKSWTEKEMTISLLEQKGYKVQKARRMGKYDVFTKNGLHKVAVLFSNKVEAAKYLFN